MKHKIIYILISLIMFSCGYTKQKQNLLSQKISEIEKLQDYGYFVTLFPDSIQARFYNREEPKLIYHPYRYLRDTATISELLELTDADNPFVKLYSFSALEKRNYHDLFSIVIKHISDTTKFYVFSDDHGWNSTTIDMMLHYSQDKFTNTQKDSLKHLILTKYNNIGTFDNILLFFKPDTLYYPEIKKIALQNQNVFSLIALSTYQNQDDVALIRQGFNHIQYYSGTYIYFKAIENFPNKEFLPQLLEYKKNIKENSSTMDTYMYYYYALAKYQNEKTFEILKQMTERKYYSSDGYWYNNLINIYKALKKHECNMNKSLMISILEKLKNVEDKDFVYEINMSDLNSTDYLDNNAWNY